MEDTPETNAPAAAASMSQEPQPVKPVLYYVLKDGVQVGPYMESALHTQVARGALPTDIPVWKEGMTEWQAYNQVFAAGESSSQKMLETALSFLKKVDVVVQETAQKTADKVQEYDWNGTFHKINATLKEYGNKATHLAETYQDGKKSVGWKKLAVICGFAVMVLIGGIWIFSDSDDNFQKWVASLEAPQKSQQEAAPAQPQEEQPQEEQPQEDQTGGFTNKHMQMLFRSYNRPKSTRTYSGEELAEAARQKRRMEAFDNQFGTNTGRITDLMRGLALAEQELAKAMTEGRTDDVADLEQYIGQKKRSGVITIHLLLGDAQRGDSDALADLAAAKELANSLYARGWLAHVGRCLLFLILLVIGVLLYRSRWIRSLLN